MRFRAPIVFFVGALAILTSTQIFAASRSIRTDNPGADCYTPDWSSPAGSLSDPYGNLDGNSDGSQNSTTFFSPGTVVTQPAIFCAPTAAFAVGVFPGSGDSANPASQPHSNPDPNCGGNNPPNCGSAPTIADLTATGGVAVTGGPGGTGAVMYEWVDAADPNLTPDAEVIVWALPASTGLPNGAFEIEFDNWCSYNDGNSPSGAPPFVPPSPPPSFTWSGIAYKYIDGCNNFYGDDLLFDATSGAMIGYVVNSTDQTNDTIAPGSRGWQALLPPSGPSATAGSESVTLHWTAASGAASYQIFLAASSGGEGNTPVLQGVTGTSAEISGLRDGQQYFFTEATLYSNSVYPNGFLSPQSAEVNATVLAAVPTGLAVGTVGGGTVGLKWNFSNGASSYDVYQSTASGGEGGTPVASGISGTSYTVSGLDPGQTYFFDVAAADAGGNSAASNEVSATLTPSPPGNVSAMATGSSISLSWAASPGATGYAVYEGTSARGESSTPVMPSVTGTSATISNLSGGQTYYFILTAQNAGGTSASSNEVSATIQAMADTGKGSGGGGSLGAVEALFLLVCLMVRLCREEIAAQVSARRMSINFTICACIAAVTFDSRRQRE